MPNKADFERSSFNRKVTPESMRMGCILPLTYLRNALGGTGKDINRTPPVELNATIEPQVYERYTTLRHS